MAFYRSREMKIDCLMLGEYQTLKKQEALLEDVP